jgi:hypothetical protein
MNLDKYIGKVVLLNLLNNNKTQKINKRNKYLRPKYFWIVNKNNNNRYIVRKPKKGILLKNLHLKHDKDFNGETLLPIGAIIWRFDKSKSKKK